MPDFYELTKTDKDGVYCRVRFFDTFMSHLREYDGGHDLSVKNYSLIGVSKEALISEYQELGYE